MKIVVRTPNWIGDSVLSLPVIHDLKRSLSETQIWIATHERVQDLFSSLDFIEGIISIKDSNDLRSLRKGAQKLKEHHFDIGLLLTNSFSSALLFFLAKIPQRWGYALDGRRILLTKSTPIKNEGKIFHQVQFYQNLLSGLGIKTHPPEFNLHVNEEDKRQVKNIFTAQKIDMNKLLILINPGAFYGPAKRWPASNYAKAASLLQERYDAEVLIIGSPDERELAETVASSMKKQPHILTGKTTLRQLAALISYAALLVTNDSGPMHIANALRTPVVALFGPTDPKITGPYQKPSVVLKKNAPCWPCTYRECPYDHRCLVKIEPEEVYQACQNILR